MAISSLTYIFTDREMVLKIASISSNILMKLTDICNT